MINANCTDKTERIIMRNIDFKSKNMLAIIHHILREYRFHAYGTLTNLIMWNATEYTREYSLLNSPFYQIIY